MTLATLRESIQSCRDCDLYRYATQPVAGEGPISARVVFIGEQPGDQEDRQGRPFVGPAGLLLDRGLEGIWHRSIDGLYHECSEGLQVRRARETPDSQEAERCVEDLKKVKQAIS